MRRLPPLHALRAFEAAARHCHFANAADELSLTPTAISHQVRHLEDILGVTLFHRYPRPIRLTAEGEQLFPVLRDALDQIAATIGNLSKPSPNQPIRISVTLAFASRWLMPRLPALRQQTGLQIEVEAGNDPVDLHGSGIDMAIRYAERPGSDAEWQHLFTDRILPVAGRGLPGTALPLTPAQVLSLPLLHYRWTSGSAHAPSWDRWRVRAGINDKPPMDTQVFSEEIHAIDAAIAGQGAILASEYLVTDLLANGTLLQLSDIALPGLAYWAVFLPQQRPRVAPLLDWFQQQT